MGIPITVRYKYKAYKYSPRATRYSQTYGRTWLLRGIFTWMLLFMLTVFCVIMPLNTLFNVSLSPEAAAVISIILTVVVQKCTNKLVEKKFDSIAQQDAAEYFRNHPEEFMRLRMQTASAQNVGQNYRGRQ